VRQRLVEQAQRVAHAAGGGAGDQLHRRRIRRDLLGLQHARELAGHLLRRQRPQVELQAARQDGGWNLLRVGGRQQELDVRRGFFERLQQRVEAALGEHVHLVDEVHLVAALGRRVLDVLQQLTGVVHAGARGGVDLNQVHEAPAVDGGAGRAFTAGFGADALLAVQRLGEQPRHGGLADAARAGEQVRVVQTVARERVAERPAHVLLTDHVGEAARAPLAGKRLVAHGDVARGCTTAPQRD
jgi:hypothetical protein